MTVRSDQPTRTSSPPSREQALVDAARQQARAADAAAPAQPAAVDPNATLDAGAAARSPGAEASPTSRGPAVELPPPGAFPGYRITRRIHGGGQGVVYQAVQISTGQKVALKVMREGPFVDPRNRARLERCIHILGELNHPGIVRIIDSGQTADAMYYAMDYVTGHALGEWLEMRRRSTASPIGQPVTQGWRTLRRRGPSSSRKEHVEIEQIVRLFIRLCDALNAAHVKGVIHRDIKPGNVIVDAGGEPHILDFDLAKILIGELDPHGRFAEMTQTGEFLGSLRWSSPEQVQRVPGRIDMRTDVYALGVLMFEALTGQAPYPILGTRRDLEDHILNTEPPRPSNLRRQISDDLDTIVLKCLSKSPERRYQSAGAVADDLRSTLAGAPISARRDSSWYLLRKLVRRHAVAVTLLAATVTALLSAAAISAFFYRQAGEAQRERAEVAQAALDRALLTEQAGRQSQSALARLSMGWFLYEWRLGHIQRAKEIRETVSPAFPERQAMTFLLDPTQGEARFLAETPAAATGMAYFLIGERHLHAGRAAEAAVAFRQCLSLPPRQDDDWYRATAAVRMAQLGVAAAASRPAEDAP